MTLAGKTLFITGASRGIGKAIALRAARDGANVAVLGKTDAPNPKLPGTVHETVREIEAAGGKAIACVADIRFEEQVTAAVAATVHAFVGMTVQGVLFFAIEAAMGLLRDRNRGIWRRFRAAPVPRTALLGGRALSGTAIASLIAAAVLLFGAAFFGVRVSGSAIGFLLVCLGTALMAATKTANWASVSRARAKQRTSRWATCPAWSGVAPVVASRARPGAGSSESGPRAGAARVRARVSRGRWRTTIRSPLFRLPDDGRARLHLRWWLGHDRDAGPNDGLRVHLVDADGDQLTTLLEVSGDGKRREPVWRKLTARIPSELAGQRVGVLLEAADAGDDATVEAGVDDVRVTLD